ncbi:uncharacterized protein LTHEOB_9339 [Lasiodiplodia theobromae]|uniref:uncharacterized protein n=1 Tax=Lasiodiplodia theobromae TaxID=45133 RepID=UPI0015C38A04|nr:uncharacterized protein LTHEOB_9339 [Lasiodiplodia theobromae]KAF4540243.1 hypothetical protein LTHEOB_9339 [Lasiodiplodia theobromae]
MSYEHITPVGLDTMSEPNTMTEPDVTIRPDITMEPDSTIEPDGTVEPDSSMKPNNTVELDSSMEPDSAIEPGPMIWEVKCWQCALSSDGSLSHSVTAVKLFSGQIFTVHTDLLCYWSPKLRAMLEYKTEELKLDLDVQVFRIVLHWLYTKEILGLWDHLQSSRPLLTVHLTHGGQEIKDQEAYYRQQDLYYAVETYIFATTYDIRVLRNMIMDEIYHSPTSHLVSYAVVLKAYHHLPPTSSLLTYFVDEYAEFYTEDLDEQVELVLRKKLPNEFLVSWLLKSMDSGFKKKKRTLDNYIEPTSW